MKKKDSRRSQNKVKRDKRVVENKSKNIKTYHTEVR